MTSTAKKSQIKKLLEKEKDPGILDLVEKVLERRTKAINFDSDLVKRVLRSEEDLKAGRYSTLEEFDKEMDEFIDGLYAKKPNGPAKAGKKVTARKRA